MGERHDTNTRVYAYSTPGPSQFPPTTPHLNPLGLEIRSSPQTGRGVYATTPLDAGTVVEISPALVIPKEEYDGGAGKSVVKDYVFSWGRTGDQALALGLGSLFNHSPTPNVEFRLDLDRQCVVYTLIKPVRPGDELVIFYGHSVHFGPDAPLDEPAPVGDGFADMALVDGFDTSPIPIDRLPFELVTSFIAPEERPLELGRAWVMDVEGRLVHAACQWARSLDLIGDEAGHLKRVRKGDDRSITCLLSLDQDLTLEALVSLLSTSPELGPLVTSENPYPYLVPMTAPGDRSQLAQWTKHWPTSMPVIRTSPLLDFRTRGWSPARVDWTRRRLAQVCALARRSRDESGQLGVACLVTEPWDGSGEPKEVARAEDSRARTGNDLCHAFANVIDAVASLDRLNLRTPSSSAASSSSSSSRGPGTPQNAAVPYLLTGLTVFASHEPCLLCSMALLHSRIAVLVYAHQVPGSGGCGSVFSVHEQKGLNHTFEVWRWKGGGQGEMDGVELAGTDA